MEDLFEQMRAELADRYAVERELGRGGMAVVYLARDIRHERHVALKVLRSDLSSHQANDRFLREIRTVARLHHRNILPLYDSGTAGGQVFYVMPFVEGETLRERLARDGPLPLDEATRLTKEIADALQFAHSRGIVHRDIKPANILLDDGHAVIADFGIALAMDATGLRLTESGLAVGTPSYMSPEQAMADPKVDARADQYALACVLYEMLAGEPPFTGPTPQVVMARHNIAPVPPLTPIRAVPPAMEAAIVKALAKAPIDRWPSVKAFAESLEIATLPSAPGVTPSPIAQRRTWMAIGAVSAMVLVATLAFQLKGGSHEPDAGAGGAEALRSVAVLPFTLSGDTTQSVIADGMTEGLITSLVRVEGLRVPASGRMLAYRDRHEDPRVVGKALGVAAMVTGAIQVAGNRFRVTAQLTRAEDGLVLWRDQFNGELVTNGDLKDLFTIQDDITGQIVDALLPKLASANRAALARGVRTRDPEAWKLYLQARRIGYQLTEASTGQAKALLEQAITRDPNFSDAWAALVFVLDFAARFSTEPPEHFNAAIRRAANRAVETDPENGFAYTQRASLVLALQDWDWDGARRDMQRALKLSPGSTDVLREYAGFHGWMNEPDTVLTYARRAFDSTAVAWDLMTWGYALNGKADSALMASERGVAVDPGHVWGYFWQAMYYLDAGRGAAADRAIKRFLEGAGNDAQGIGWAAEYYRRAGNAEGARAMLDRLTAVSKKRSWGVHSAMAMVRLAMGDRNAALDALEEAARRREYLLPATVHQALAPLQREPRFVAVRKTVFGNRAMSPPIFP